MPGPWRRPLYRLFGALPPRIGMRLVHLGARRYLLGVACLVVRPDGRVLLLRQSYRTGWSLPGGLVRRGEDVPAALRREVVEETGIALGRVDVHRTAVGEGNGIVTAYAVALVPDDAAIAARARGPEVDGLRWEPLDGLLTLDPPPRGVGADDISAARFALKA